MLIDFMSIHRKPINAFFRAVTMEAIQNTAAIVPKQTDINIAILQSELLRMFLIHIIITNQQ